MVHDTLRNSSLTRTLGELLGDFADLMQKEFRLARAEVTVRITAHLQGIVWMLAAGFLGLAAALLIIESIVLALVSWGVPPYLSCLLVAAVLAGVGAILFYHARSLLAEDLIPTRAVRQINQDIKAAKEQLT
jgi:hypothetical protein